MELRVLVAGLDQDYRGRPFEPIPQLLAIAESVTKTMAVCMVCGAAANRTQRMVAAEERVLVGAGRRTRRGAAVAGPRSRPPGSRPPRGSRSPAVETEPGRRRVSRASGSVWSGRHTAPAAARRRVRLCVVTKGRSAEAVREAVAAGARILGENRVQEAGGKIEALSDLPGEVRWDLIGHLQRNKARKAVGIFHTIQSLDSLELARRLSDLGVERRPCGGGPRGSAHVGGGHEDRPRSRGGRGLDRADARAAGSHRSRGS